MLVGPFPTALPMISAMARSTRGLSDRLLRLPIATKVLVANTVIVVMGAAIGTWLTATLVRLDPATDYLDLVLVLGAIGTILSVAVNHAVLRAAFAPLRALERTVSAVRRGDLTTRARRLATSDPSIDQLGDTLNGMLDELVTYRSRLRAMSSQVIRAQEEERLRIARELHDETAQALTSIVVHLRVLQSASDLAQVRAGLSATREITMAALEDVRKLAIELRPTLLDHLGLVAALEEHCRDWQQRGGIEVEFSVDSARGRLHEQVELVIYRVAQEALTNVARHARAGRAHVRLAFEGDEVTLTVDDDGVGFPTEPGGDDTQRLGLFGMRERVELVGGSIAFGRSPLGGARVNARVPHEAWQSSIPTSERAPRRALAGQTS